MTDKSVFSPRILRPEDANQNWQWDRALASPGFKQVDFETRVDFQRLRKYRLSRAKNALKNSGLGALILFDVNNIRYITGTKIGEWERDKLCRFALLAGDEEPFVWDFGSAAVHHQLNCDWLDPNRCLAGMTGMRGTVPPSVGLMKSHAEEIMSYLKQAGVADMPIGLDIAETAMFFELQNAGMNIVDGQQVMLDAREIKNIDEITLLNQAATMVDGVYHMIYEELKPGVRENDIVALSNQMLYEMGSDDVEAINAISGERCSPHPHNFTDRMFRPGDQAFFDILQSYQGYRTCYYRTFNVGTATSEQNDAYIQCREWLDKAIELIKPGVSTDVVAKAWPKAEEFGFESEMQAFGLQFGHGLGLALHERPIISRLVSLENPMEIKTGMVFALETYCPAKDGVSAARIEEEVVVTDQGCKVISLFPADELPIANRY
ncbi:MAG: M24 family metallopeptidase [Pseudomonadota bacterium]|jgi:Xaa-Pro aminopeptidase|nr:aminopeptidase [Rhodobiaceae bacterium]MEC7090336.1 M24 family metallopeptidase [Pseudomonadota bacterium]MEC7927758.1 M24 family metallopeptidase [Pseudomonadota bacterium]MEC8403518.1 M24 family metallopeptidase [Pseudomonadota bacterium]MEC8426670.1 M24 family metallopeptidase [Pseudomonadota bacterium]|tara:strand:- start:285 stop:1589 length:1305 start_codon:yes stop_codon:yes gene_type:complete